MPGVYDGEVGVQTGDIFQKKVVDIFSELQFDEISRFKHNIDFIGTPPKGYPEKTFIKPVFCKEGIIAIEATTAEPNTHTDSILAHIDEYNSDKTEEQKIKGAILAIDFKRDQNYADEVLRVKNIHVWDIRRLSFYSMKILLQKRWLNDFGNVQEMSIDEESSYIFTFVAKKIKEPAFVRAAIFIENKNMLQLSSISEKTQKFISSISEKLEMVLPLVIDLQIHILNDWIKCNDSDLINSVFKDGIHDMDPDIEIIKPESVKDFIFGYGCGPWHPFLYAPYSG